MPNAQADKPTRRAPNEIIGQEWIDLQLLWERSRPTETDQNKAKLKFIDDVFEEMRTNGRQFRSDAHDWAHLNETQIRVGAFLTEPSLSIEYLACLRLARRNGMAGIAEIEKQNARLFSVDAAGAAATTSEAAKRAAYVDLLTEMQALFVLGRRDRRLRRDTSERLFYLGAKLLSVAVLPLLVLWLSNWLVPLKVGENSILSSEPIYGLIAGATFGLLGAFFSRLLAFQSSLERIGFEEVMRLYEIKMLSTRLLFGVIGAILFHIFLRSGLVAGGIFPDMNKLAISADALLKLGADGKVVVESGQLQKASLTLFAPTAEFAKFLVWSFIAGFSERLVPDALTQTEARSQAGGT